MIKTIFFSLFFFFSLQSFTQTTFENNIFGLKFKKPDNWIFKGYTEFDSENNQCNYNFLLPNSSEPSSEWDNRMKFTAKGNGYANSLADVLLFERQKLYRELNDLKIIKETKNSILAQTTINDVKYNIYTLLNYQHGISYLASFSFQSNQKIVDTSSVNLFFTNLSYYVPLVKYDDIDFDIKNTPDDATLYFKKAERKFNFHDAKAGMIDVNKALEIFPLYGEAYYLRAYLHLSLGDTVEACADFHSSIAQDFAGDSELSEYCNTRKIAEALENRNNENNPIEDFSLNANHIEYADSIKKHEFVILSFGGEPNKQVINYMNQLNHLFKLDFKVLDSLYKTQKGILQLYSFGIMCQKYPEQINNEHKKLLKNEDKIMVLSREQNEPQIMLTREIASLMYKSIEAFEKEKEMQLKTEGAVSKFIKNYSKYPETYESLSFEQFHIMSISNGETLKKEKNSEDYIIGHRYRIKNVHGNLVECFNTFKFDFDFKVNIIEGEESNTYSAFPPMIQEWLDQHGRALNEKDKKSLGLQ